MDKIEVLSPEGIEEIKSNVNIEEAKFISPNDKRGYGYDSQKIVSMQGKAIAKEALKDTLRQVVERLDGIENPHKIGTSWHDDGRHKGFNEAIQTIKQSLQQAIVEVKE